MLKLCVGAEIIEDLAAWQQERLAEARAAGMPPMLVHVTRMWPKREGELLEGGSLYWVIRGNVLVRQRLLALEPRDGADGIRRCALVLDPTLVRTTPQPRRPFQGWRYLRSQDAPADLASFEAGKSPLPASLLLDLAEIGVL